MMFERTVIDSLLTLSIFYLLQDGCACKTIVTWLCLLMGLRSGFEKKSYAASYKQAGPPSSTPGADEPPLPEESLGWGALSTMPR